MKFFGIVASLLVSTVVAAPTPTASSLEKRSTDSILASLTTLESAVTDLNTTLNNFKPVDLSTLPGILKVLNASNTVGNDIIAVTKQLNQTGPLENGDDFTVGIPFLSLVPNVESLLTNIIAVRPKIDMTAGLFSTRKTVLSALQNDRALTVGLFNQLSYSFVDSTLIGVLPGQKSELLGYFDKAIANYSKAKGGIDLPAIPSNTRNGQVVNY